MTMTDGTQERRGRGRPATGSTRIDFAAASDMAAWLGSRANRTIMAQAGDAEPSSLSRQAKATVTERIELQAAELAAMAPIPLAWANVLAEVTGGDQLSGAIFAVARDGTFRPVLWAEWTVRQSDARAAGHPDDTFTARYGIDEDDFGGWLRGLTPGQDDALRDAMSRWWADVYPADGARGGEDDAELNAVSVAGFAIVGLRVMAEAVNG